MEKYIKTLFFVFMLSTYGSPNFFDAIKDRINIYGFVSQGYLKTINNNYLGRSSKKSGSFEFLEAALTVYATPIKNLRIGIQLLARDILDQGNLSFQIDWAYGDYKIVDWFGIRAGRIKNSLLMYNASRDVDVTRIPIFLPQSVYSEAIRDLIIANNGALFYGNINLKKGGDIEYEVLGGAASLDPKGRISMEIYRNIAVAAVPGIIAGSTSITAASYTHSSDEKFEYNYGAGINTYWSTPIGLKIGISYATFEYLENYIAHFDTTLLGLPNKTSLPIEMKLNIPVFFNSSIEWTYKGLTIAGEYQRIYTKTTIKISGTKQQATPTQEAFYGFLSYRFSKWFAMSTYYSVFFADMADRKGKNQAFMGNSDFQAWQKDIALSFRFDFNKHWLIKLEGHYINGTAQALQIDNPLGFKKEWWLMSAKTSFHF